MARVQARSKTRNYSQMDAYKCKYHSKKKKNAQTMKMQMHIFLKYFIAHSIAQPDHYYCVFILIGKNVGHI